jgi:hypothetical protein
MFKQVKWISYLFVSELQKKIAFWNVFKIPPLILVDSDEYGALVERQWQGKTCRPVKLSSINLTGSGMGSKLSLRSERDATRRLRHGTDSKE